MKKSIFLFALIFSICQGECQETINISHKVDSLKILRAFNKITAKEEEYYCLKYFNEMCIAKYNRDFKFDSLKLYHEKGVIPDSIFKKYYIDLNNDSLLDAISERYGQYVKERDSIITERLKAERNENELRQHPDWKLDSLHILMKYHKIDEVSYHFYTSKLSSIINNRPYENAIFNDSLTYFHQLGKISGRDFRKYYIHEQEMVTDTAYNEAMPANELRYSRKRRVALIKKLESQKR